MFNFVVTPRNFIKFGDFFTMQTFKEIKFIVLGAVNPKHECKNL